MSDNEEIKYISDSTVPNAGRIYDYILGGDYNFEVDRKIADELLAKMPIFKKTTKVIRWFLGDVVDKAFEMGFTQFLDFASGLPTVDHIHTRIPEEVKEQTKIIYSDIDPITVQIGREIIGINPAIKFLECDCRKPGPFLESNSVKNFFDKNKKIAIGLSGILYFLSDDEIKYTLKTVYDWAPKGSIIYFCDFDSSNMKNNEGIQLTLKYYEKIKQPFYLRTQDRLKELITPWNIKEPGFLLLEKWLELSLGVTEEQERETGGMSYGGILEK